jgi:hypothetical protein
MARGLFAPADSKPVADDAAPLLRDDAAAPGNDSSGEARLQPDEAREEKRSERRLVVERLARFGAVVVLVLALSVAPPLWLLAHGHSPIPVRPPTLRRLLYLARGHLSTQDMEDAAYVALWAVWARFVLGLFVEAARFPRRQRQQGPGRPLRGLIRHRVRYVQGISARIVRVAHEAATTLQLGPTGASWYVRMRGGVEYPAATLDERRAELARERSGAPEPVSRRRVRTASTLPSVVAHDPAGLWWLDAALRHFVARAAEEGVDPGSLLWCRVTLDGIDYFLDESSRGKDGCGAFEAVCDYGTGTWWTLTRTDPVARVVARDATTPLDEKSGICPIPVGVDTGGALVAVNLCQFSPLFLESSEAELAVLGLAANLGYSPWADSAALVAAGVDDRVAAKVARRKLDAVLRSVHDLQGIEDLRAPWLVLAAVHGVRSAQELPAPRRIANRTLVISPAAAGVRTSETGFPTDGSVLRRKIVRADRTEIDLGIDKLLFDDID